MEPLYTISIARKIIFVTLFGIKNVFCWFLNLDPICCKIEKYALIKML